MRALMAAALIAAAGTASAAIGEPPYIFERGKPTATQIIQAPDGERLMIEWRGKKLTHIGVFVKTKDPRLGSMALVEAFYYNDDRPLSASDLHRFLVGAYTKIVWTDAEMFEGNQRSVGYDSNGHEFIVAEYGSSPDGEHKHMLRVWFIDEYRALIANRGQQQDTGQRQITTKRDCMVVATEMYARLKNFAPWAAIVGVHVVGQGGHAMAVWKVEADGKVFVYVNQEIGSIELQTHSTNLDDIAFAFNAALSKVGAETTEWRFLQEPRVTVGVVEAPKVTGVKP